MIFIDNLFVGEAMSDLENSVNQLKIILEQKTRIEEHTLKVIAINVTALCGIAAAIAIANAKEFISTPCVQDSFEFLLGVVGILVCGIWLRRLQIAQIIISNIAKVCEQLAEELKGQPIAQLIANTEESKNFNESYWKVRIFVPRFVMVCVSIFTLVALIDIARDFGNMDLKYCKIW